MPARIGNWLIQANWKLKAGGLIALFLISAILDYYAGYFAGAMTGAGHGIYTPVLVLGGLLWYAWPFLVAFANSPWSPVRIIVKTVTCVYYIWLILQRDFTLGADFERISRLAPGPEFMLWGILTLLLHALIWLPFPLLKFMQKCQIRGELNLALQK